MRVIQALGGILLLASAHSLVHAATLFEDQFNGSQFDLDLWDVRTNFTLGRSFFRPDSPVVSGGFARLRFDTLNPFNPGGTMLGTEIMTGQKFGAGDNGISVEARIRVPEPPGNELSGGVVAALFGFEFDNGFFDEIDFELLTNDIVANNDRVLTNTWKNASDTNPLFVTPPGIDLTQFNTFKYQWLPDKVRFFVNNQLVRTTERNVPDTPMNVRFNFWAPKFINQGAFDDSLQPVTKPSDNRTFFFDVDYIKITDLDPMTEPAIDTRWRPIVDSNWFDAGNWSNGVPAPGDSISIDVPVPVTFRKPIISPLASGATDIQAKQLWIGIDQAGIVIQEGLNVELSDSLNMGVWDGAIGTYELNGGTFKSNQQIIGERGIGGFTQTGGTNTVDTLYIAKQHGSEGAYSLRGDGSLLLADQIVVGAEGVGVFSQRGGRVETRQLIVSESFSGDPIFQNRTPEYEIQGGELSVSQDTVVGQGGSIAQIGGDVTVGSLLLGGAEGAEAIYRLSDGSLETRRTTLSRFGQFAQTGGTHTVGTMWLFNGSIYEYLGGTLEATGSPVGAGIELFSGKLIVGSTEVLAAGSALTVTVSSINNDGGTIELNPGTTLHGINASVNNFGATINANQATLQFDGGLSTGSFGATINLTDSTFYGDIGLRRGSLITAIGTVQVNGTVTDSTIPTPVSGGLTFGIDGVLEFNGHVHSSAQFLGTGTARFNAGYSPGKLLGTIGDIAFEGDVELGPQGAFTVELTSAAGGLTAQAAVDALHDSITVTGGVTIAGTLDIDLLDGFVPQYMDTFEVILASVRSGEFDHVIGAFINPDMALAPVYDYEGNVGLTLVAAIPGDANLDGIVNGLDLLTWQANLFSGDQWVQGDFNLDGLVSGLDLLIWQSHLFNTVQGLGGGAAALAAGAPAVPEPSSLAALGVVGCLAFRRWRCRTDR